MLETMDLPKTLRVKKPIKLMDYLREVFNSESESDSESEEVSNNKKEPGPKKRKKNGKKVEDYYEVEKITDHKMVVEHKKNKLRLRVKWKGYKEQTWEEFSSFARDSPLMVQKYLVKRDKAVNSYLK